MMKTKLLLFLALFMSATIMFAQKSLTVSGIVTESGTNLPAIGVSVLIKGTSQGTITSYDGDYSLENVPSDAVLVFSYVGMKSVEEPVNGRKVINVFISEDTQALNEVVVVGYGTSKAKDLTSPITSIKSDEINKLSSSNAMQAIQGKVPGVQIVNSGEPGAGPTVRIRGVGSFTNEGPLYVVDGMFYDNINFLNPSDIEDMSVLKDASAAAIYGVRAANGVILITTKKGSFNRDATLTYNGYVGIQNPTNMLKMASGRQYTEMLQEKGDAGSLDVLRKAAQLWGGEGTNPTTNTDWYDELSQNAFMQNHSVDLSGGTEKAAYSVGLSYLTQEGILSENSDFERFTMRTKGDYKPFDWLKVGTNIVLTKSTKHSGSNDAWFKAFIAPSIVPVYDENNALATGPKYASLADINLTNGYYANPVAMAHYQTSQNEILQIMPSVYAEISFIPSKLSFKTTYSQDISLDRYYSYTPTYVVGTTQKQEISFLDKADNYYFNHIIDNILTYTDSFGKHNMTALLGNSVREENYRFLRATAQDVPGGEPEYGYIDKGDSNSARGYDNGTTYRGLSFFGRVTYNYDSRYLLALTMRADGSSKYNEKWGYFPSVGLGWVASEEAFMRNQKFFDFLKMRASWGKLGNDKIAASAGFAGVNNQNGAFGDVINPGIINENTFSWLQWEVVSETNVGLEAHMLDSRLKLDADYYTRTTNNAVVSTPQPITGEMVPANAGKIRNSGLELNLTWSDKIGSDFNYSIGANLSTLKNEVVSLKGNVPYLLTGSAEFRTIIMPGEPINSFYGYKVVGVYQNQAQIDADPISKNHSGLEPGDLIYEDLNGDGVIDSKDRQILGSNLPKFTYGFNMGMSYKNFDFSLSMLGVAGNKIVNQKRGVRRFDSYMNYDADLVENRWQGEGTSNKYPSASGLDKPWNISNFSSFLVESGNYFRIQNIQLGYTFNHIGPKDKKGVSLRVYASADRPFTFFKYNGFTPEITSGFDTQTYPMASNYTLGVKLTY
ncbi:MAG: SusC/RagA family TonB-linked outer membrane protein [Bacteroidales bacterium]